LFLNSAAFAIPMPGTYGNLERNSIHGPGFKQVDFLFAKHFRIGGRRDLEFRGEIFNLFNTVNYANPVSTLSSVIPTNSIAANTLQPGQAYSEATAGQFGRLTGTVGRPRHRQADPVRTALLVLSCAPFAGAHSPCKRRVPRDPALCLFNRPCESASNRCGTPSAYARA
jgi:hypothetical protein